MNLPELIAKWTSAALTERSAAQSWFIDLCSVLGVPTPTKADPPGAHYAFERGAAKTSGGDGREDRPRYTSTACFETFPFPWPPGTEPLDDPRVQAIAAAKALDDKRRAWLDPPGA